MLEDLALQYSELPEDEMRALSYLRTDGSEIGVVEVTRQGCGR